MKLKKLALVLTGALVSLALVGCGGACRGSHGNVQAHSQSPSLHRTPALRP